MPLIRLLVMLSILVVTGGAGRDSSGLGVTAHYECLWWSPQQMENLNPDKPPPKETRVAIDRWEYSDPVGVPNPDTVILVVRLRAAAAREVILTVKTQWLAGKWSAPAVVGTQAVRLDAGIEQVVEITIPVAHMILDKRARRLRSLFLIDGVPAGRADLPVVVGD